ncbi:MAG: hypothetical protein WCT42_04160 [Candidatus Paceibacterota bacterium]|jgi:hypothetical protein
MIAVDFFRVMLIVVGLIILLSIIAYENEVINFLLFLGRKINDTNMYSVIKFFITIYFIFYVIGVFITDPINHRIQKIKISWKKFLEGEEVIVEGYIIEIDKDIQKFPVIDDSNTVSMIREIPSYTIKIIDKTFGEKLSVVFDQESFEKYKPQLNSNVRYKCFLGGIFSKKEDMHIEYVIYQV